MIFAMKRSGHHAIAFWIAQNFKFSSFYNDIGFKNGKFHYRHPKSQEAKPMKFGIDKTSDKIDIYNAEDFDVRYLNEFKNEPLFKTYDKVYFIIIGRDPYNWIASCYKVGAGIKRNLITRIKLYKKQMKRRNEAIFIN